MHPRVAVVSAGLFALVSCAGGEPTPVAVQGECADAFGAQMCSWATLTAGQLTEYGVTVPLAAIEAAPADHAMAWPPVPNATLRMPAEVTAATGVDHFTFFWEPHGHPPGAYLTPHFDFHFYGIDMARREAIDCTDPAKPASPATGYALPDIAIPELGTLVGLCVPAMGMHAAPVSELESTTAFDGTMVIGYYQAAPIFFEPMIAKAHLLKRQSFDLAMPTVPGVPEGVRYPSQFRAVYDSTANAYRFTFSGP